LSIESVIFDRPNQRRVSWAMGFTKMLKQWAAESRSAVLVLMYQLWQASHQGLAVSLKIHQPGAKTVTVCDLVSGKQTPLSFSWDLNDPNTGTVVMRVSVSDTPQVLLIQ
jgi:hypothetical protein